MVYCILGLLVLLIAVLAVRTAAFKPKKEDPVESFEPEFDGARAIEALTEMVRCKTVSSVNPELVDEAEFEKFRALLVRRYPLIHKTCTLERIDTTGLLYRWVGKSSDAPTVLMSHYDVVPADEASWEKPPYAGIIEDGILWGRGTLDTKGTLCGVMESVETMIAQGFVPQNDVYLSFAGDEEIAGPGAPAIVDVLESRGIRPELVVDEGGAVVEKIFPGVTRPCALIGVGEKGMMQLEFKIKSNGGHASMPPAHGLLGKLGAAILRVEGHPFPARITPPVAGMFDMLARHSSGALKMAFANMWLFRPLILKVLSGKADMNAMVRTTCAFTMAEGSKASNVLPPEARVAANLRLIGGDTPESALQYIRSVIKNDDIELVKIAGNDPSPYSDIESPGYQKLSRAIEQTWDGAIVSPYLMMACSDSRHFCRISDKVMRFSAMELTPEERGLIHGHNERIPTDKIVKTVAFYLRLVRQL